MRCQSGKHLVAESTDACATSAVRGNSQVTRAAQGQARSPLDFAVVLTATVDARDVAFVARRDPQTRLADYKRALGLWLTRSTIANLILCENSGHDLYELREVADRYCAAGRRVDFLSFEGQSFPGYLGKGFGEMGILKYVLDNHGGLSEESRLLKVSGRYFVENVDRIAASIRADGQTEVFCDLSRNLSFASSEVFCASARYLREYLLPLQCAVNDTTGQYFEHVLAQSVHRALAEGVRWSLLPCFPVIVGVSGSIGLRRGHSFPARVLRQQGYRLKRFLFQR
jgi:hypothetical protein